MICICIYIYIYLHSCISYPYIYIWLLTNDRVAWISWITQMLFIRTVVKLTHSLNGSLGLILADHCNLVEMNGPMEVSSDTVPKSPEVLILFGGLEHVFFFHILGISSSQLTDILFRGGLNHQPEISHDSTHQIVMMPWGMLRSMSHSPTVDLFLGVPQIPQIQSISHAYHFHILIVSPFTTITVIACDPKTVLHRTTIWVS